MCRFTFLILILNSPLFCLSSSPYYFDYNAACEETYASIMDLKLDQATIQLIDLEKSEKYNLARLHLENYHDFITVFISEDEALFRQFEKNKKKRIASIKRHLSDDNPYKKYCIAEMKLQCALVRPKFGNLFNAARELYASYKGLIKNKKDFPEFYYNNKSLSIIHALIETLEIPGLIKSLLGLESSLDLAQDEIIQFIDWNNCNSGFFSLEADAIYSYILSYQLLQKNEAFSYLKQSDLNPKESLLSNFLIAQLAQQSGKNDLAIEILKDRPRGKEYADFQYLELMLGISKLRKLDPSCRSHLNSFLSSFKGKHYLKEACQKLAWSSLVFDNDTVQYWRYISKINSLGKTTLDADQQAQKEFESCTVPNKSLLKARLLSDGGYYETALQVLDNFEDSMNQKFHFEFNYRKARIYHKSKRLNLALSYYKKVSLDKSNKGDYKYCNSELQMGIIHEQQDQNDLALLHYKNCLNLSPGTYKRSLHQKARTGLRRIEKW